MDLSQLIIDHPALAMLSVLPVLGLALLVKLAITFSTPHGDDEGS